MRFHICGVVHASKSGKSAMLWSSGSHLWDRSRIRIARESRIAAMARQARPPQSTRVSMFFKAAVKPA